MLSPYLGIRQGYSLSPFLFDIVVHIRDSTINQEKEKTKRLERKNLSLFTYSMIIFSKHYKESEKKTTRLNKWA